MSSRRIVLILALLVTSRCGHVREIADAADGATCVPSTWSTPDALPPGALLAVSGLASDGSAYGVFASAEQGLVVARRSIAGPWSAPEVVSPPSGAPIAGASIGVAADGSAIAVWERAETGTNASTHLYGSHYTKALGWSTAQVLDAPHEMTPASVITSGARVVMRANGHAFISWSESDGSGGEASPATPSLNVRQFDPVDGWSEGVVITSALSPAHNAFVASDAKGNATMAWSVVDSAGLGGPVMARIQGARWDAMTRAWSAPVFLDACVPPSCATFQQTHDDASMPAPRVVMDANGNAFVVYSESRASPKDTRPWVVRWSPSEHSAPVMLDDELEANDPAFHVRVAIDAAGDAMAVWQLGVSVGMIDGVQARIFASRFSASAPPSHAVEVDVPAGTSESPEIAMADDGSALVTWDDTRVIMGARFDPSASTFGAPMQISPGIDVDGSSDVASNVFVDVTHGACPTSFVLWTSSTSNESSVDR